jgi:hypothetical protein
MLQQETNSAPTYLQVMKGRHQLLTTI